MGCSNRCSNASSSFRDGLFSTGLLTVVPRFTGSDTHISHEKEKYVAKCSCIMIHNYVTIILAFHTKGEHVVKTIYRVEYRWIRLSQKTLKSNFAQDEAFLFFISRPKLLFIWLILQRISQKWLIRTWFPLLTLGQVEAKDIWPLLGTERGTHWSVSQHHIVRHDYRERYTLQCLTAPHRTTWRQREVHITVSHGTTSYDLTTERYTV